VVAAGGADGGEDAAAGVEERPWHGGGVEERPWRELGCPGSNHGLAVAAGELAQAATALLAAARKQTVGRWLRTVSSAGPTILSRRNGLVIMYKILIYIDINFIYKTKTNLITYF